MDGTTRNTSSGLSSVTLGAADDLDAEAFVDRVPDEAADVEVESFDEHWPQPISGAARANDRRAKMPIRRCSFIAMKSKLRRSKLLEGSLENTVDVDQGVRAWHDRR